MSRILFLFCIFASVWGANSISVTKNESVLVSYLPCDLAFINFVRINESNWQGLLHFSLYPDLKEVLMEIYFEKEVTISPILNFPSVSLEYGKQSFVLHSKRPIPKTYTFNVFTGSQKADEKGVPKVHNLTLNNEILCSSLKRKQSIESLNVKKLFNGKHYAHSCGKKSIHHAEHLSLRTEAQAGDWPWHVAIFYENDTFHYQCGGSIVSTTAVLTAGHCIFDDIPTKDYFVVAGISSYANTTENDFDMKSLQVQQIIKHPKYKREFSTADLAIIKVEKIEFTVHIQPVCIWGPSHDKSELFGMETIIVGFGENEDGVPHNHLRAITMIVQKDTTCKYLSRLLNKSTFCAGNGPNSITNVRNGDSGGGLLVRVPQPDHTNTWFIRGVLSKCGTSATTSSQVANTTCDPQAYVVFTDVAAHYGWITQNAGLLNPSLVTA
ncbi:chymotrypsin-C [Helicoverpa armigera]|uniref:chymotrypsin-C n=1 Tax=Helicoverpa armigera TaxID=29058 RepID=UPI0030834F60